MSLYGFITKYTYIVAFLFFNIQAFSQDIDALIKEANSGNIEAQSKLGLIYDEGKLVRMDKERAFYWFSKSAKKGDAQSQYYLGWYYFTQSFNKNKKKNINKAIRWLEKSARQDNIDAQLFLATIFEIGAYPTPSDKSKAFYWYLKSARLGNAQAQYEVGKFYRKAKDSTDYTKKAIYWLTKCIEQNNKYAPSAQYELGRIYADEEDYIDYPLAFELFNKSAEAGCNEAEYALATMYFYGKATPVNKEKAFTWFKKSANSIIDAMFMLSIMYYKGDGTPVDKKQAFYWAKKAAQLQDNAAQLWLGILYFKGAGVEKNDEKALYWIEEAAKNGLKEDAERYMRKLNLK